MKTQINTYIKIFIEKMSAKNNDKSNPKKYQGSKLPKYKNPPPPPPPKDGKKDE